MHFQLVARQKRLDKALNRMYNRYMKDLINCLPDTEKAVKMAAVMSDYYASNGDFENCLKWLAKELSYNEIQYFA